MTLQRWALKLVPARRLANQGASKDKLMEALGDAGRFDASGSLSQVACPTLVVCGSRDRVNLPASRLFEAQIPGARLEIFERSGHSPPLEEPERFQQVVRGFLDAALAPTAGSAR